MYKYLTLLNKIETMIKAVYLNRVKKFPLNAVYLKTNNTTKSTVISALLVLILI